VHQLLRVLSHKGELFFKRLSLKIVSYGVYCLKHPIKAVLFIVKLYISLMLFGFFLTASFSTFAHEVDANSNDANFVITGPLLAGFDGQPWGNQETLWEGLYCSPRDQCSCTFGAEIIDGLDAEQSYSCDYMTQNGARTGNGKLRASSTVQIIYTCPPSGYSDHTVLNGNMCNTPTGTHPDPAPEPEPDLPSINCGSLAGGDAINASFKSPTALSQTERDAAKCSDNPDSTKQYSNSCHIVNSAGWIESEVYDEDGFPTGEKRYTAINGTFSGFACDPDGEPTANDESCTAFDNGLIKKVECPDGTSMTVNWEDFLAVQEAFVINRAEVNDSLNTLTDAVANVPTTDDVVIALTSDQAFKDSVKGEKGEACTSERLQNGAGVFINCEGSQVNLWDGANGMAGAAGAAGAAGEAGEDGKDGEDCQAVVAVNGVKIVCKDSVQFLSAGENGEDGDDCTVVDDGINATITCGGASATVEGVDEGGIIDAISTQTDTLTSYLEYTGDGAAISFENSPELTAILGTANDYEVRNYGTVMEAAVNRMKESPVFTSVDGFFEVTFSGTCPTYSANIPVLNTTVVLDHWCLSVMDSVWPMIQAIVILILSFYGFRVAIL
jgi:hypothetical protein